MDGGAKIRVGVNGAKGRMGGITIEGLEGRSDMELVFTTDKGDDLAAAIKQSGARVVVDFTVPDVVFENTMTIVRSRASPVVGTTGLAPEELERIDAELLEQGLGGIVAPNFSLGALLMMKFASEAARLMPASEIIEFHHPGKLDSPSGTALMTAEDMGKAMIGLPDAAEPSGDAAAPSRGLRKDAVRIHSVRLPGIIARQQVIFGGSGETLTLLHDVTSRNCFLPGIVMAIHEVLQIQGLQKGLNV